MKYLLDTCVISEIIRPKPSGKVTKWIKNEDESNFFISVLTIGEFHKGIEKLSESKRKRELHNWVENDLKERFWSRIIDIDMQIAMIWGKIQSRAECIGRPMPAVDSLIAATGITHNLTIVTRNISDMKESGVPLFNPWE
ncbi:MAG: type II toxin-antitoxin system VapC family toxin [Deltaproteobacteria bacterium]|nr:type II toxin-antitoxin system VapC family toxin [Deltaproteobacteria bacterium]